MRASASRVVAMIPARVGSTRLKLKNLALLCGKPLVAYAIESAKAAGVFRRIVLNCDSEIFSEVAQRYGAELYVRPRELGSSTTHSDEVVQDFMTRYPADAVAWVNTTSPLQPPEEIRGAVTHFLEAGLDTLMTVKEEQVHCVLEGHPVNFTTDTRFARTQDLVPVQRFVYSVMMWRTDTFLRTYQERRHAFFCGRVGYYPVSKRSSIIVKTAEDLILAEAILRGMPSSPGAEIRYDPSAEHAAAGKAGG